MVVSKVIDSDGEIAYEKTPTLVRKVISEETSNTVRGYLRTVIDSGTGKKAKIDGMLSAVKQVLLSVCTFYGKVYRNIRRFSSR